MQSLEEFRKLIGLRSRLSLEKLQATDLQYLITCANFRIHYTILEAHLGLP